MAFAENSTELTSDTSSLFEFEEGVCRDAKNDCQQLSAEINTHESPLAQKVPQLAELPPEAQDYLCANETDPAVLKAACEQFIPARQ